MDDDYVTKTIKVYDHVAEEYAKQIADHIPTKQRLQFISLLKPGDKILDAGCGSGRECKFFVDNGFSVVGVDLSEKMLAIAKKTEPAAKFYQQDLRKLDFPDASFHGVWSCASLHHIKRADIPTVLSGFSRIIKPGGILLVHVKKGQGEEERIEPSVPGIKRFYTLFSESELMKYIQDAGFTILDCYEYDNARLYPTGKALPKISCFARKI
jgi:ubiquinone/menaquinone biosynthesis C-methylase UbiE